MYIELIFGGTIPKKPEQDYIQGTNDLYSAAAARFAYEFEKQKRSEGFTNDWMNRYMMYVADAVYEWS